MDEKKMFKTNHLLSRSLPVSFCVRLPYRILTEKICITYDSEQRHHIAHIHHANFGMRIYRSQYTPLHSYTTCSYSWVYNVYMPLFDCSHVVFSYYYYITRWSCVRARFQKFWVFLRGSREPVCVGVPVLGIILILRTALVRCFCQQNNDTSRSIILHPSIHPSMTMYFYSQGESLSCSRAEQYRQILNIVVIYGRGIYRTKWCRVRRNKRDHLGDLLVAVC